MHKPGSVGLPVPGVQMCIRDPAGAEVADGVPGEVCVRGASVMKGYFNLPDATREAFFGDWFRTGDLGVPRRFVIHASLPKNATGKILKRELRRTGEAERGIDPVRR